MKLNSVLLGASLLVTISAHCEPSAIQAALPSGADVNFAYSVPANGTFTVPKSLTGYPNSPVRLPALCAISVKVQSINNSSFDFGLFLPENWNGRFLAVGNGGFAGGINYIDIASGVRYGFAAMSTDTGHNSSSPDGSWAYQHPERIANWGHLAMHGSVVTAKKITTSYYKEKLTKSYYLGCSTGGRQGLKEAEAYPDDFDGIVAGAPAWWTAHMQLWTVRAALYNLPTTSPGRISASLFAAVNAEVLKQCDPQDGLTDSIISDPEGCNFRAEALLCGTKNVNASSCLTSPQLDTLYNIYSDYVGENNTFFFPSLSKGFEADPSLVAGDLPLTLGTDYPTYFLGLGPDWNYTNYNDDLIGLADSMDPGDATVKYDLSAFQKRGGKILSYHGLADGAIPAKSTSYFYNHVDRTLAPRNIDIDSFFKFFFVPGMGHCSGTSPAYNAPWYFAGSAQHSRLGTAMHSTPGYENAEHDVLLAMVAWVEEGRIPEYVVGTKFVNETQPGEVMRQRPLCMYPKHAKYTGQGDPNSAKSWSCNSLY